MIKKIIRIFILLLIIFPLTINAENISLKNVWFSYSETPPIVKDIKLRINKGDYVAIVGKTGCGKDKGALRAEGECGLEQERHRLELHRQPACVTQGAGNQAGA